VQRCVGKWLPEGQPRRPSSVTMGHVAPGAYANTFLSGGSLCLTSLTTRRPTLKTDQPNFGSWRALRRASDCALFLVPLEFCEPRGRRSKAPRQSPVAPSYFFSSTSSTRISYWLSVSAVNSDRRVTSFRSLFLLITVDLKRFHKATELIQHASR
jgi:hypothetical protein